MYHLTCQASNNNNITHGITSMNKHVMNQRKVVLVWYKEQRKVVEEGGVS